MSRVAAGAVLALVLATFVVSASALPTDRMAANGRRLKWGGYSGSWSGSWGSTTVDVKPGSTQTSVNTPWYSGSWGSNWGGGGGGGGGGGSTTNVNTNSNSNSNSNAPAPAPGCYTYDGYGTYVNVKCDGSTTVNVAGRK